MLRLAALAALLPQASASRHMAHTKAGMELEVPARPLRLATLGLPLLLPAAAEAGELGTWGQDLDQNGDGRIDAEEFKLAATSGEDDADGGRRAVIADLLFGECDLDGDGAWDAKEWLYCTQVSMFSHPATHAHQAPPSGTEFNSEDDAAEGLLKLFDADGDGGVDKQELWNAACADFARWGLPPRLHDTPRPQRWFSKTFSEADLDGDGKLDAAELQLASVFVARVAVEHMAAAIGGALDSNGDGVLKWDELAERTFRTRRKPGAHKNMMDLIVDSFGAADHDGDEELDATEVMLLAALVLQRASGM